MLGTVSNTSHVLIHSILTTTHESGTIMSPILQMWTQTQSHPANKRLSEALCTGNLVPKHLM